MDSQLPNPSEGTFESVNSDNQTKVSKKCLKCKKGQYHRELCKQHFIAEVMARLRREIRNLYRGPDKAYAALDFTGIGHISESAFLDSAIGRRVPYSREELSDFLL